MIGLSEINLNFVEERENSSNEVPKSIAVLLIFATEYRDNRPLHVFNYTE